MAGELDAATGTAEAGALADASAASIIVSGSRASLERAEEDKRQARVLIDGISDDDLGDLPDNSISEALVRIAGVTANNNGAVSIRGLGPDLLTIQYNGRILPASTNQNRRVQLGALPTEGVASAYAQKTSEAATIEGGVAGLLSLQPLKPLENKEGVTLVARGTLNTNSAALSDADNYADVSPRLSASIVKKLADNFGIALTYAYFGQRNAIRQTDIRNWRLGTGARADLDGDGVQDALPSTAGALVNYNNDFRHAAIAVLQWEPTPGLRVTADAFYNRDRFSNEVRRYMAANLFNGSNGAATSSHVNDYGVVDQFTGNAGMYRGVVNKVRGIDKTLVAGFNVAYDNGGPIRFSLDASRARASRDRDTRIVTFENDAANANAQRLPFSYDLTDTSHPLFTFSSLTAEDFSVSQIQLQPARAYDHIDALRFDASYVPRGESVLESIDAGVRVDSRHATNRADFTNYTFPTNPSQRPDLDSSYLAESQNPLYGTDDATLLGGASATGFPWYDLTKLMALTSDSRATVDDLYGADLGRATDVKEETYALYGQANFRFGPVSGNIGARYVLTDTTVKGQVGSSAANVADLVYKDSYHYFLPALNLRYEPVDGLVLRAAASKTLSRPQFGDMAVGAAADFAALSSDGVVTISRGNPRLKPFTSKGIDLGVEWYPDQSTSLAVQGFVKYVTNFLVSATESSSVTLEDGTVVPVIVNTVVNDPRTRNFRGFEVIARRELNFLPGFLHNLGVQVNWNHTLTNATEDITSLVGTTAPVPANNYSRDIVNAQLYYSTRAVNVRLAYRYYSVASRTGDNAYQALPTGLLDLNASVKLRHGVRLIGSVTNLLNDGWRQYLADYRNADNSSLTTDIVNPGRVFNLGVRVNF